MNKERPQFSPADMVKFRRAWDNALLYGQGFVEIKAVPIGKIITRGQSHRHSLFESISNVIVGFIIATGANWIVMPLFGYNVTVHDSMRIGLILTVVSVIRSYVLRRVYNQIYIKTGL